MVDLDKEHIFDSESTLEFSNSKELEQDFDITCLMTLIL